MVQHWNRWLFASISKHFDDRKQTLPLFIEGQHRDTREDKDFLELRVDGPRYTEVTRGYWHIYQEINILVQSVMDDVNYHKIERDIGIVVAAMTDIHIFKYGDQPEDTEQFIGCLKLIQDLGARERVQVFRFGQIDVGSKLQQAAVEGHYQMYIDE